MLKSIDINKIKHKNICIIGKRHSGKTRLYHDILTKILQQDKIDIIIISPIEQSIGWFDAEIISEIDDKILKDTWEDICKKYKKDSRKTYLVIDDMTIPKKFDTIFSKIVLTSRHYGCSVIHIVREYNDLGCSINREFDYYFMTSPSTLFQQKKIYTQLFEDHITKKQLESYYKKIFTNNSHLYLVFHNSPKEENNKFSYYKVDIKLVDEITPDKVFKAMAEDYRKSNKQTIYKFGTPPPN